MARTPHATDSHVHADRLYSSCCCCSSFSCCSCWLCCCQHAARCCCCWRAVQVLVLVLVLVLVRLLVLVLLRLLLRIGTRHQHRRDRRRHRQGQGVSKPAAAGPARSQQEEGLGESRVAHVPSDAGSAPRSVACFGPAPSSEALCYSMKSSHPPPQPHASAAPAWVGMAIRPRSWSREHQSDCGEAHALPVAPANQLSSLATASAPLTMLLPSNQRLFEGQGPSQACGAVRATRSRFFFLGVGLG